ncbi:uncharacterized protein LOC119355599 [Triticum dicoccoides]|uniref:uncharacterized protein LOC119355599 n=1 Tax=Triticum dicoccoides TaxID=85692 RepID=UPI00188DDB30|nr:uncharacterized protein LOC119355599 [Triticum dicoccoides]
MADAGGKRPDWGTDLVEQARQVDAGTFVRGRASVQRGAPSARDMEKAGAGRSGAVQLDAPALANSGEAQKVEAGSDEAQKVGAGSGEAHEVEKVEAGSGEEEAEQKQEEEDLLGNKRKWDKTGFYPYESDEDEPYEYESGDDVVEGNIESFKEKEVLKIMVQGPAKYYEWRNEKYWCPYCSKPKPRSGLLEHLMEHCRATSISSHDYKIIGQHSALLKVLRNPDL